MSKIICDVCGTSYPETASQCPICGSARSGDVQVVADSKPGSDEAAPRGYQYVKGGRFSNKNVHKRNSGKKPESPVEKSEAPRKPKQKSNKPLIIVAVVLLLCVVATAGYIAIRFFAPADLLPFGGNTTQPAATTVPCMSLQVSQPVVELTEKGATYQIAVTAQPQNTTDTLTYQSSDPAVATVDGSGLITAVAPGQTVITIFCGDVLHILANQSFHPCAVHNHGAFFEILCMLAHIIYGRLWIKGNEHQIAIFGIAVNHEFICRFQQLCAEPYCF